MGDISQMIQGLADIPIDVLGQMEIGERLVQYLHNFINTLSGDYETMDAYSAGGGLANFGVIAAIIPAILLALLVTGERPFSSLSSSCGGWRWPAFWKCLGVAAALYVIEIIVQLIIFPDDFTTGECYCSRLCLQQGIPTTLSA